jgi:hypothetical protein
MRRRYIGFHKVSGRILFILLMMANISTCTLFSLLTVQRLKSIAALTIVKHAFGGTITTQAATVTLAVLTTFAAYKSWAAILNLRIDRHRAWVLRAWSYAGAVRLPFPLIDTVPKSLFFRSSPFEFFSSLSSLPHKSYPQMYTSGSPHAKR